MKFLQRNNIFNFKVSNILNYGILNNSFSYLKNFSVHLYSSERKFLMFDKDFKRFITFVFWSGTIIPTVASVRILLKWSQHTPFFFGFSILEFLF